MHLNNWKTLRWGFSFKQQKFSASAARDTPLRQLVSYIIRTTSSQLRERKKTAISIVYGESLCTHAIPIKYYLLYTREREVDNRTSGCILFVSGSGRRRRRRHYGRTAAALADNNNVFIYTVGAQTHARSTRR